MKVLKGLYCVCIITALAVLSLTGVPTFAQQVQHTQQRPAVEVYNNGTATAVSVANQTPSASNCVMVSDSGSKSVMVPNGTLTELSTFACRAGGGSPYCQNARNPSPSTIPGITVSACDCSVPQNVAWGSSCQGTIPAGTTNTTGSSSGAISSTEPGTTGSATYVCTDSGSGLAWQLQAGSTCTQGCTNPVGSIGQTTTSRTRLLACDSGSIYKIVTQTCTSSGWVTTSTTGGSDCLQNYNVDFLCGGCGCDGSTSGNDAALNTFRICQYRFPTVTDSQGNTHPWNSGAVGPYTAEPGSNDGGVYPSSCDHNCSSCNMLLTGVSCYYSY